MVKDSRLWWNAFWSVSHGDVVHCSEKHSRQGAQVFRGLVLPNKLPLEGHRKGFFDAPLVPSVTRGVCYLVVHQSSVLINSI